jgi:hypothetical protein
VPGEETVWVNKSLREPAMKEIEVMSKTRREKRIKREILKGVQNTDLNIGEGIQYIGRKKQ